MGQGKGTIKRSGAMFFGVAYYPEHWPEERWPVDAQMMQQAGLNAVRMGEFGWSKFEPVEGTYDFDWLDRAVELLAAHGIKTMMCTCSRTPPPWVFRKYPEILNVRADGHVSNYGHRYTVCLNDPTFIELSQRIDRAVVEHYAGSPNVIAWHIDNEIGAGNDCTCETCRQQFIAYLRDSYGTVERLNASWGAHFWSFAFSSFEEVPLPVGVPYPSPNLALEYARFRSKVNAGFARWRYDLIRQLDPGTWVTTNFQTSTRTHTDIFELGEATDVYGTNFYPPRAPEFALDYCRGERGELLVLEQRSGQPHWLPSTRPGWMRLWAYRSIAHGACGISFFRWRPCLYGQEEYWHGVLPHSGRPNRRYRELAQMGAEIAQVAELIDGTRPRADVAIVMSYESRWALEAVLGEHVRHSILGKEGLQVHEAAVAYHGALMGRNICTDGMDPRADLSRYRLVIAPRLYCVGKEVVDNLRQFVSAGGVLCLTPRSGVVDKYNKVFRAPAPGPLVPVAGVEVDDHGALDAPVPLCGADESLAGLAEGVGWADEIVLAGAEVVATYGEGWLEGTPAITLHQYGAGKVVYVGTLLRGETLAAFVSWLCDIAGVSEGLPTPEGVSAHERQGDGYRLLFLLNYAENAREVSLEGEWKDLLAGQVVESIRLGPADVCILKRAWPER